MLIFSNWNPLYNVRYLTLSHYSCKFVYGAFLLGLNKVLFPKGTTINHRFLHYPSTWAANVHNFRDALKFSELIASFGLALTLVSNTYHSVNNKDFFFFPFLIYIISHYSMSLVLVILSLFLYVMVLWNLLTM